MDKLNFAKTLTFLNILGYGQGMDAPVSAIEAALVMDMVRKAYKPESKPDPRQVFIHTFEAANFLSLSMPSQNEKILYTLYKEMPDEFDWETIYMRSSVGYNMVLPATLIKLMSKDCMNHPKNILIAEGIKFLPAIKDLVKQFDHSNICITCEAAWQSRLIEKILHGCRSEFGYSVVEGYEQFEECSYSNVEIVRTSIYEPDFSQITFDVIIASPVFGVRQHLVDAENRRQFIGKQLSDVAVENLMSITDPNGELKIILPQGFLFQSDRSEMLRSMIAENYSVEKIMDLPIGMFRPYSGVNTVALCIKNCGSTNKVIVEKYVDADKTTKKLRIEELALEKSVDTDIKQINVNGAWNIAQFFSKDETAVVKYHSNEAGKAKLSDVAEVSRGKSVSQKEEGGQYGVINIGNIGEYDLIKLDTLQRCDYEKRQVKNYILQEGDVLIPARGSAIRCIVFHEQDFECIASSNVIVVRPIDRNILDPYYLKIFFDSEIGKALIAGTQSGTAIMNVSYKELQSIMVPTPDIEVQRNIATKYLNELKLYQKRINEATERWNSILAEVQKY